MLKELNDILAKNRRVAIVGGPRTGKTTMASYVRDRKVYHTDDFMHLDWKDQPDFIIQLLKDQSTYVVEGVQVARALRKGLPVDAVIFLRNPKLELNVKQEAMRKTVDKVFTEWYDQYSSMVRVTFME